MEITENTVMILESDPVRLNEHGMIEYKDGTDQLAWVTAHRKLTYMRKQCAKWHKASRDYGVAAYGLDFVAESEAQMELDLGIESKERPPGLNPPDKSKAIVTIEGIHTSFMMWLRKMNPYIETWELDKLERGIELTKPMALKHEEMVNQAKAIRERLQS
jgi:hypothetical protein